MSSDPTATAAPLIQVPPLTVTEWGLLRSTLHTAGLVHQSVSHGPVGGMLRVGELPEPFRSVYRKVCDAARAD